MQINIGSETDTNLPSYFLLYLQCCVVLNFFRPAFPLVCKKTLQSPASYLSPCWWSQQLEEGCVFCFLYLPTSRNQLRLDSPNSYMIKIHIYDSSCTLRATVPLEPFFWSGWQCTFSKLYGNFFLSNISFFKTHANKSIQL